MSEKNFDPVSCRDAVIADLATEAKCASVERRWVLEGLIAALEAAEEVAVGKGGLVAFVTPGTNAVFLPRGPRLVSSARQEIDWLVDPEHRVYRLTPVRPRPRRALDVTPSGLG